MSTIWKTVADPKSRAKVNLVLVTNKDLGLQDVLPQDEVDALRKRGGVVPTPASLAETYAAATARGYKLCREGLAPAVRKVHPQDKKEHEGECLVLASELLSRGGASTYLETVHNDRIKWYAPGQFTCSMKGPLYPNAKFVFEV